MPLILIPSLSKAAASRRPHHQHQMLLTQGYLRDPVNHCSMVLAVQLENASQFTSCTCERMSDRWEASTVTIAMI